MSTIAERIRALLDGPMPCEGCGAPLEIIQRKSDEPYWSRPGTVQVWPEPDLNFVAECVCSWEWSDEGAFPTLRERRPWLAKRLEEIIT